MTGGGGKGMNDDDTEDGKGMEAEEEASEDLPPVGNMRNTERYLEMAIPLKNV